MVHPLIQLAKEKYYLGSHLTDSLLTGRTNAHDNEFKIGADRLVRSIDEFPHAFMLACLMDTGVDADVAWTIPYRVKQVLGTFDIEALYKVSRDQYIAMFSGETKWHRYPSRNAGFFYEAVQKIVENEALNGDASEIWAGKPNAQDVILRFLDFKGCGFKIANMAPNILYRYYGIEFSNYSSIDIAPDIHTIRVFQRLGLTPYAEDHEATRIYTICAARELNPEFPGIVDGLCWEVGRNYCNPRNPKCVECPFANFCEKQVVRVQNIWDKQG